MISCWSASSPSPTRFPTFPPEFVGPCPGFQEHAFSAFAAGLTLAAALPRMLSRIGRQCGGFHDDLNRRPRISEIAVLNAIRVFCARRSNSARALNKRVARFPLIRFGHGHQLSCFPLIRFKNGSPRRLVPGRCKLRLPLIRKRIAAHGLAGNNRPILASPRGRL